MNNTVHRFYLTAVFILIIPFILRFSAAERYVSACAQSQDQCTKELDKAEKDYDSGNFQESLQLIEKCLNKPGISKSEIGRAYRLLGLVYIGQQLQKEANDAVKKLLLVVPNYKVNPQTDSPQLKKIIRETAENLLPEIKLINPDTLKAGSGEFTLTVKGSNFAFGSVIKFNGKAKSTVYVNTEELKAVITKDDILNGGDYDINVLSPIMNGKLSNTAKLIVLGKSNFPWKWLAIGGGAVVAAVVAVLTLGGKSSGGSGQTSAIADPPARP